MSAMVLRPLALALAAAAPAWAYQFGATDVVAPRNLSAALAWTWHHPEGRYRKVVAGGPVIDRALNLYIVSDDGVRKLSPEGQELWHYTPPGGVINNEATLFGDSVLGSCESGYAFALDGHTGKPLWERRLAANAGPDCGYPAAFDGVFVVAAEVGLDARHYGGNARVFGLDAGSGATLWEFRPETPVWNLTPLFPGDGTTVFMDFTGGVYRLGLHNGTLLWHSRAPGSELSFSDGGASLSPDGSVYTCSNFGKSQGTKEEGNELGALRAFRVSDGRLLWERLLAQPCNSYPAVSSLDNGSSLSVVITPGPFLGAPELPGSVEAFNALTGEPQWQYQAPPFNGVPPDYLAKGDVEGFPQRALDGLTHAMCMPAHWSAPTISGDGTVYVGRLDGLLYAVHGTSGGAGVAAARGAEAEVFDADGGSLHGAFAWAPGMLAFASCDTLFVFKF